MQRGPQVEITITAPDGTVFRKLSGPATAGLHSITWNFRGEQPKAAEQSPWEKKEQARIAARAKVVADSLKQAGWSAMFLDRMLGVVTGTVDREAAFAMFMGTGAGGGRDPEAFQERPGETAPGSTAGAMDYGQMRTLADLINPGGGMSALFRRFGGSGGQAPLAAPGTYTLTLKVGDATFTRDLRVEREAGLTGNSALFEEEDRPEPRRTTTGG